MSKGLIIKKQWLDKIFNTGKCWEMRSTRTKIGGLIKLIEAGTGRIVGEAMLAGCHEVSASVAAHSYEKHQVDDLSLLTKWRFAWRLCNVKKYDKPIAYKHPQGAVIWAKL